MTTAHLTVFWQPGIAGLTMSRVVAIKLHVLVRSNTVEIATIPQPFYFDNQLRDAIDDGQIRREYSVTVAVAQPHLNSGMRQL